MPPTASAALRASSSAIVSRRRELRPARSAPRRAAGRARRASGPRSARRAAARCRSAARASARSAFASVSENVVSSTRRRVGAREVDARGAARRSSCRCPPSRRRAPGRVVALDQLRAAPGGGRPSTSPTGSRARAPAPRRCSSTRKRRCASGCSNGIVATGTARLRDLRRARRSPAPAAPRPPRGQVVGQRRSVSSSAWRTSSSHSRDAVAQQLVVGDVGEERRLRRRRAARASTYDGHDDLLRPSRGSRRAARRRSSGASRACAARPRRTPCRGGPT